jgi:hypothetical protein
MPSFILPANNGKATPQSVERKRRMAQALMEQGMQTSPIASPWQGFARMAQALSGGLASRRADEQDFALQDADKKEKMARLLKEDQWRESGREHEWGQDAFNNARMRSSDAMQRTQFQDQQDALQLQQDQRAAQQGLYEDMTDESVINQTAPGTHPGNMQGPMKPQWKPEQFNQAQMYAAGGDYGKAGELLNPIISEEPYNLAPDNLRMQGSKVIAQGLPKKPDTEISIGGGSDKQVFDRMGESATSAAAAVRGLNAIREAKKALPGAILGAGADMRLGLAKVASLLGADPSAVVDTETFRSAIAPQVAALIKATVGSTQISNTDRDFAEKAAGGQISLDAGSIARLLDIMERSSNAVVNNHKGILDKVYPEGKGFERERALFGVDYNSPQPDQNSNDAGWTVLPNGVKIRKVQ